MIKSGKYLLQNNYVWACRDVTAFCEVSASSRQNMTGCLTDGSTETFWESGEEDRNKVKWIQMAFPGGTADNSPHIVCVYVDNTRDPGVSNLYLFCRHVVKWKCQFMNYESL